jgi:hypothetical protein
MSLFDKLKKNNKSTTRQLIGAASVEDCCLTTSSGENIAYLIISPVNLNVLSDDVILSYVENLAKSITDIGSVEILCINSAQSYENNKRFLSHQIMREQNEALKELDRLDIEFLDDIQVRMATSREFLIMLRFGARDTLQQVAAALEKSRQTMTQNGFLVRPADKASIKRMLAIYFEQNLYEDEMQDFDGERFSPILEMKK